MLLCHLSVVPLKSCTSTGKKYQRLATDEHVSILLVGNSLMMDTNLHGTQGNL